MSTRVIAALIGLAVVLPTLVWGGVLGVLVLSGLVLLASLYEWTRMAVPDKTPAAAVLTLSCGCTIFFGPQWFNTSDTVVLVLASMATLTWCMLAFSDTAAGQRAGTRLVAGLVYIALSLRFVVAIRSLDQGLVWLFLVLVVTWMGDTGAYFAGRVLGHRMLFPRISPNKTWEGAAGGMLAAVWTVCVFKVFWLPTLTWGQAVILGVLLDVVGVVGDLVESMFKRSFGVKDSGRIMPGHGGLLDRVDSLLFTAPTAWFFLTTQGLG